ncbi:MAG: BMP family lipoprotein [Spirochaetota bacterium]
MKRSIIALLAALLLLGALASCARDEGEAAEAEPDYRIGIVFDVGGRGDNSFNDSAYRGLTMLAEEFNGYIVDDPDDVDFGSEIELTYLEPQAGGQDREQLLRVLAEDGYDLIFGVGFAFTDSLSTVAEDFPETEFGIIDTTVDLPNVTSITFAEHEGSFLVGALTGLFVADNAAGSPIGFLGGMDIPLIHKFHGGFFAGAMWTNESLRDPDMLFGQYIGQDPTAFSDPQTASSIASNFYDRGAFAIYHAAGASGSGLFSAAADADRWVIGVDSDQGLILAESDSTEEQALAEHILTSMLKRVDRSVFEVGSDFITNDGELEGGVRTFGVADGGVGVAVNEYNEDLVSPYMDQIDAIREQIVAGEISVPDDDAELTEWANENL